VKHFKKYLIFVFIIIFLLGGLFHRQSFFPFNTLKKINSYLYHNKFKEVNIVDKVKNKSRSIYEYKFLKNVKLFSLYKDEVKIDFEKKQINIEINKKNNFFIISGVGNKEKKLNSFKNWKISLKNKNSENSYDTIILDKHFNKYGVRGCLNLFDLNTVELDIFIENCNLENALEIVSVDGTFNNIFINNSKSDSLDVDFGNLKFKNVVIQNSGSDCLDLNKGNYLFKNLVVYNCHNPLDVKNSYTEFKNLKIFSKEQKNEFKKYKIF
tara:strand:+ start:395 stop:1195 length:801 start_codon:yes stop_codon:yes gene_type:complete